MPNFDKEKLVTWAKAHYEYDDLCDRADKAFTGWDMADGSVFFSKIKEVIVVVEEAVDIIEHFAKDTDSLSNKDKLDAAVDFLDDLVKFNMFIEMVDGIAIKMMLSTIVQQKNRWFGPNWFESGDDA